MAAALLPAVILSAPALGKVPVVGLAGRGFLLVGAASSTGKSLFALWRFVRFA